MLTSRSISLSVAFCLGLCAQSQTVIDRGYGHRPANRGMTAAALVSAVSEIAPDSVVCDTLGFVPERVETVGGSAYDGVICEQVPGKGIVVDAVSAVVRVGVDSLKRRIDRVYGYDELPAEWKSVMKVAGDTISDVTVSSLIFPASEFHNVVVTDESDSTVTFHTVEHRRWHLLWMDVHKTVKYPSSIHGVMLKDVITLKDGHRIEGHVSEQVRGKTMSILLDDGSTVTVPLADVTVSETAVLPGTGITMFPYIDAVVRKADATPVSGAIVRRDMGKSVTVLDAEGVLTEIPLAEIVKYLKEPNPAYRRTSAARLADGEVRVNGREAYFVTTSEAGGYRILPDGIASLSVTAGEPVVIEARLSNPTAVVGLIRAYRMVVADQSADMVWDYDVLTDDDFADSDITAERTWNADGVTTIKFNPLIPGDYVVALDGQTDYLIIHVKQPQ